MGASERNDPARIVVINDDPVQLRLITRVLEGGGYEVSDHTASAGALTRLAEGPRVDLFVVDLHMPGIDGWKVCRLLRSADFAAYNDTPILIVSATFTGADVEAITADTGADGFVPMPLSRDELLMHVSNLLEGVTPRRVSHALLVEDNEDIARSVEAALERNGYVVRTAGTIEDGERMWGEQQPDLVLLDYHLPDGTGPELLERLQDPSDRTVVLVMTGDSNPGLPVELLQLGADGYVRKPFDPRLLVELAAKATRERSLLRVEALLERRTQELRRSDARYRSLFAAIPDMVLTIDEGGRVVTANDEAIQQLGRRGSDLAGQSLTELVPEADHPELEARLTNVRTHGADQFETRLTGSTGSELTVEITASAPEAAEPGAVVLVARDLTERRRAEEERRRLDAQVQHAQRLESLGVLAGGIAHDFNNLLVGVMGNASLAMLDVEEDSPVHVCIAQIETAARRAAELTQQILTFSGKGRAVMSAQNLSSVIAEMGQLLGPAVSKKAKITYHLGEGLPLVEGDPSQLRQVAMNLIMNASDALGDRNGNIQVTTAVRDVDPLDLGEYTLGEAGRPGRYVGIEVTDDGCGMDAKTLNQIFDPFFTTKVDGRGLGLAATVGIVRSHAGLLTVDSELGRGTTFRILLPATDHEVESDDAPPAFDPEGMEEIGGSILVVDDESSVRTLAKSALERAGFGVEVAEDGTEALEMIEAHPGLDVVVLDLTMPSMDGMETLEEIRAMHPGLPVLLSSGYGKDSVPYAALRSRDTAFLRKPYSPQDLLEAVVRLLRPEEQSRSSSFGSTSGDESKVLKASG